MQDNPNNGMQSNQPENQPDNQQYNNQPYNPYYQQQGQYQQYNQYGQYPPYWQYQQYPYYQYPQYYYNNGYQFFDNNYVLIQKAKSALKSHSIRIGLCILAFLASPYVLSILLGLFNLYDLYTQSTVFQYSVELIYSVIFLFLPFFLVYRFKSKEEKAEIAKGFDKPKSPLLALTSIGFGLMLCFCGDYISSWISAIFSSIGITLTSSGDVSIPTSGLPLFLFFVSTAITPAIIEEFAMRAVVMQPLRKYGDKFAIVTTAIVFGLMHRNAVQGIFAFIAGVVFGYISVATKSIWTAVIVHSLNNGVYVVFNVMNEINPGFFEKAYPIFLIAVFVIGIICAIPFILSSKREKLSATSAIPDTAQKTKAFFLTVPMIISIIWMLVYTLFVQI